MMAYGYTIKKRNNKKSRAKMRQLEPRVVLASLAMAAGIFAYPFGIGEATEIARKDGTPINPVNNVYNIDPEKVNGDFAYNRFSKFSLDAGHIANLKFGDASALANLVNSQIDINGTVNAIKNNAIGGHLYFLSPDGIVVGATGVINAGQFTGIVPTRTAFDTLYNAASPDTAITLAAIDKLTAYANDKAVEVSGQINTHSGVMLGAGIINIKDGAKIQSTKDLNFASLVNTGSANAGLGTLTASKGKGGDIILTAKQTSEVKDTTKDASGKTIPIRWSGRSTELSAAVNIGQDATAKGVSITSSDGAVKLTAESASTYEDSTPMSLTNTLKDIILGEDKTLLDGVVNKLAGKEAGANKYLFVNYSGKKNKSSVNIGANSTITGNNIDIAATSTLDLKQSIAVPAGDGKKDSDGKTVPSGGSKEIAAVAVSRVYNSADITIDGKLTATGAGEDGSGIKIAANADTKAALSASGSGGNGNAVAVGVAVLTGDTKSKVTVKESAAPLSAAQGKVSVDATTKSDVDVTVNVVGQTSYVVSNVGLANYDTGAEVTVNRAINAGAVDIKAENTAAGLKMTVDNAVQTPSGGEGDKGAPETSSEDKQKDEQDANAEKNKSDEGKSEDEKKSEKKSIDPTKVIKDTSVDTSSTSTDEKSKDATGSDGKSGVQDVKDKVEGTDDGGDNKNKNSAFGLGTAVGIVLNENNANVTLGKNAVITAAAVEGSETANGAVNVNAGTRMTSSAEKEDSFQFSVKNAQANANVEIGAAVLVSNVKNNATVLMDSDGSKSAQITGGAVTLDAAAGMGKYKTTEKKKDEKGKETTEEVEKDSALKYAVSAEGKAEEETPSTVALNGTVGINTLKDNAIVLLGQKSQVSGSSVKLSSDTTTNAEGTYGAADENSTVAIGGTVGLQNIRGNSLVMAGKGAEIKGTDSFEASAENAMDLKNSAKNAGKGDSVGISGMLALSYGDSNSVVSLDDEANVTTGFATITSINSTNIDNASLHESTGQGGAKTFGIGVGIVNYDVSSIAMVGDNGSGISAPSGSATDAQKAAQKIYQDAALARNIAGDTLAGKLGTKTSGAKGTITTGGLMGMALTTGMIQNDAKANVSPPEKKEEQEGDKEDSDKWTQWSKKGEEGAGDAKKNVKELEEDTLKSKNESAAPNASEAMGEASKAADPDGTINPKDAGEDPVAGASAGASIGIEGSVALTFLGGRTDAVLDNVTVTNGTEEEPAPVLVTSLSATDFLGSITLGGTTVKHSVEAGDAGTTVGIGGTFSMNKSDRDVDSLIRNSELPMSLMVSNSATKIGIEVAAGMGVSTSDSLGVNVNGAGVVYYNKANQDIHALMINNEIMGASVSNQATSTDFQIAGGLSGVKGGGANTNVGVGGAVAISNLENNMSSGIVGGNYTVLSSMAVEAQKGTTQINGALAGTKGSYGFEGAFAYGSAKNTTRAYIDGATVTSLGDVKVKAGEVPVVKTQQQINEEKTKNNAKIDSSIDANPKDIDAKKNYTQLDAGTKEKAKTELKQQANDALQKEADTQKQNKATLDGAGLDTTGESYLDKESAQSSLDDEDKKTDEGKIAGDAAKDEDDAKGDLGKNHSITITAAMGGGWNGTIGAGAGIAYNYVKNDIAADIKGSTITADKVAGEAASDSLIVSVGAGVAIGGKTFNGAGSGSWNDLKNDTKVTFANNTKITGKSISEQATNEASIYNIAGEVAGGKGMAMGLSLAYNSLNNTTGTYLTGNDLTLESEGDGAVNLSTVTTGKTLAVAGGVDVSLTKDSWVGAVGTVAINRGTSDTESVIDGKTSGNTTISGVKELSVTAAELTKKTTVAGGVSVGGKKVGVGGSVAYTSVGSSKDKERLRAEVNHADITTAADGKIEVSAVDSRTNDKKELEKSRVITIGAGFGVQWGKNYFNLQGGAAVSDIYKDSRASLNNTNINANKTSNHPAVNVAADTKSKINTVGVGGSVDVGTVVRGAAGVAINRMYQDTKAEMATDSGTTTVNAGLTQVRATGDGDIHSVGVGGLVGVNGQASFAGSGSYNYIGNNVDAIIRNQKLTSSGSVGVVAQSDDRLYNFAGGFAIAANAKVGIGAAVGINKITGSTNALVKGGSLTATDTGAVTVSRPQDANLFTTEKLDLTTDRQRLAENRKKETKSGIVVDSSATHTLISQLSSGGVAASSSVGIDLDGTVNLNTITGNTTAKIQDAALNTSGQYSNVNVNAIDYANVGSFTGTPAVGAGAALGLSIGVSANWETLGRTTEAEISSDSGKKNVYAKNLVVDATAKHGSSALSFAAAAGGGKVGISSGDSIMRHKYTHTTNALVKNVNAVFDGAAEVVAEHLGNSHSQNVSASLAAGMAGVAVGAGVSVVDDTSKVKSEVATSDLKAKSSTSGKNISVLAKNENNWKSTLVTASAAVAIGAGLAANVGINNTTGETAAIVNNSNLEAYNVDVKATDKLTANSIGGVGALGVGGVGVSVALNNMNSSVSSQATGGSVKASNDVNVTAEENRKFDSSVTGVAVGGIGVGVNVAITSINKGITDAQLSSTTDENGNPMGTDAGTKNEINVHLNGTKVGDKTYGGVNGAKGVLGVSGAKFHGLSSKDSDLDAARNTSVSLDVPEAATDKQGVHTSLDKTVVSAAGNVNVKSLDNNDIFKKNLDVTVGGLISATVADVIIHTNYDTDVTMNEANIAGKNVTVEAKQGQKNNGSEIEVTAGTGGIAIGVGVGYAGIVNKGTTDVNISGSTLKGAENVTVSALDESKHKTNILNVGVSSINTTTTFASVENKSNVGVTLAGTNNISAGKDIAIDAKRANVLEAHTQGVGVGGINVAVNHATIEDGEKKDEKIVTGNATAKITGTNGTFSANSFHLGATNDTTAKLSVGNTAVSVLGVSRMRGKGVMDMGAEVSVAGGSFNAKTAEFTSLLGNYNSRTLEGNVKGHNISVGVAVAPDTLVLDTDATGTVNVANSTFGADTNLILDNESYADRKGYIYAVTAGAVAVGNTKSTISGKDTLNTTLTGKTGTTNKLNSLQVVTYSENKGKAFSDAGGGSLVGYIGAHADNKSTNRISSTLGGNWDVAGDVLLVAANRDETRLTASEGHGGIAGVGGTSADNIIDTTTDATVASDANITADRAYIGTSNAVSTGAYDDTNGRGETDNQTYTLKDHFGGVISGNRLRSLVDLKENGTVTIGKNAKITTNNLQQYIAASDHNLTNHVQAKGGGLVAVTDAVSEFDLNIHNKINVESGATLSNEKAASTEGIILSAYDNHTMKSHVDGTVYAGVVSPVVTKNNINMNRTSDVNVAGVIESGAKVGLYAGAKQDGALSNLNADLKSGAYNYSVISITTPRVNYNVTADRGNVDVSGTVRATGDINVIASGGKEEVVKDQSLWNWALGGSSTAKTFLTSDAVTQEEALPKNNVVNVTGSLIAGTADPINLTIGGSVANGLTITAPDNKANNRVKNGVKEGTFDYANTMAARWAELDKMIKSYDGADASLLAAYIAERDRIQNDMIRLGLAEKDDQGKYVYTSTGRPVYFVEIPDIATGGGNINVTANDFTGTGSLRANASPGVTITNNSDAYLRLNNILMGEQGGKIVYNQDNVIPPGASQGNAKINSVNVKTNGARFGEIYGVTNGEAASLLVENKSSGPQTTTISLTDARKQKMRADVNSDTTLSAEEKAQWLKAIDEHSSIPYTSLPDVEVNGKLSNFYGSVIINNTGGDIRINGGTTDRPTGVEGNTVKLIAPKGNIAQSYKEGIVNINGDPEKYLADKAADMKAYINKVWFNHDSYTTEGYGGNPRGYEFWHQTPPGAVKKNKGGNGTESYTRSDSSQSATGYIAGRDVYVSASNININGLIQSGYKNYTATVTEAQLKDAQECLADNAAVVQNRTMYRVNKGGAKWNETDKVFDYVPQVYWDPSTKQLFVEDIDTAGGKVYLTGKIASTGDGKVMAADGAADISVTNNTAYDMNVGKVLNNQREGVITIADMADDSWLEFRKGQTREIRGYTNYMRQHGAEDDPYRYATVRSNTLSVNNTIIAKTEANQTYNWANGELEGRSVTKQHHVRYGMWGLVKTKDMSEIKGDSKNITEISKQEGGKYGLPEGATIRKDSTNVPEAGQIRVDANSKVLSSEISGETRWLEKTGFLGWFKNYYTRWTEKSTTLRTYNYSINASQPITFGLIGSEVGSINIKSTNAGGGSINLTGNVANSHNEAKLNISSAAGGITQFDNTLLKSENVTLIAKKDIKNIHIASVGSTLANGDVTDSIRLYAVSNGAGSIDVDAVGGLRNNRSLPGNVEVASLASHIGTAPSRSDSVIGSVSLSATGNITQQNNILGAVVEGRGINLTSKNGAIGTAAKPVEIMGSDLVYSTDRYGAQVNAAAKDSIYLTEVAVGGDMRVGKIESKEGDVTLTVKNGAFIDALPGETRTKSQDSVDEMVRRWIDAGLIDGEKDAKGNYTYKGAYIEGLEKDRDNYKANVEEAYDTAKGGKTQAKWKAEADQQKAAYQSYLDGKARYGSLSQSERQKLEEKGDKDYLAYKYAEKTYSQYRTKDNKTYETADAFLQDNSVAYKYAKYANASAYLAADATYKDLVAKAAKPTFEWTKDMMLYAVSEKLVNPDHGGSTQTEKAANVLGKNVTLTARGAVGSVSDTTTTVTVDELKGNNQIANMKKLLQVDAADVTLKKDARGDVTAFEITRNMPLGVRASGTLVVNAGDDIAVAGRTDKAGEHSALNVGNTTTKGDVRLYSDKGIYNALNANATNVTGKSLLLVGGKESIGTSDKPLTVALSGDLIGARADKNIFIKNMKNSYLRLGAMYAGDTISLSSKVGFLMSDASADIATSYINAGKHLNFLTDSTFGVVGRATDPIRILNDRARVDIVANSAYVKGMGSLALGIRNGTLVLGNINTKEKFVADSEGGLKQAENTTIEAGKSVELTAGQGDITQAATAGLQAGESVSLTAKQGAIAQDANAGIQTKKLTTASTGRVDLQGTGNQFETLSVQSAKANEALQGSVAVLDTADKLDLSVSPAVKGNITVENKKAQGSINTLTAIQADGDGAKAKGDITLKAGGSLQTGAKIASSNDVTLTAVRGDVSIRGDITTGQQLTGLDLDTLEPLQPFNTLAITAGGTIREAEGVNLDTPVAETYSGKGVSLDSSKNTFDVFLADALDGSTSIDGSVKAFSNCGKGTDHLFVAGLGASVRGDAEFANLNPNGSLGILVWHPTDEHREIRVLGGNGAEGNLILTAQENVGLVGDTDAAHDIVIDSEEGSFYGIGRGIHAGHDVSVTAKDAVYYVSGGTGKTLRAGNDIRIETANSTTREGGIYIGALPEDYDPSKGTVPAGAATALSAGNNAIFKVNGNGEIDLQGDVKAEAGAVAATISGAGGINVGTEAGVARTTITAKKNVTLETKEGNVTVSEGVRSTEENVSVKTGKGNITVGRDNMSDGDTIHANKNVTVGTKLGTVTIQGGTRTVTGDIAMEAGKDSYAQNAENLIIRDDGKLLSGGDVILDGRNGDIEITNDIQAKKNFTVNIAEQGNVSFGTSMAVTGDVAISTDHGNVNIGKAVTSENGSVTVNTRKGNIWIGNNESNTDTVSAKQNISLIASEGTVSVQGGTETQSGDIKVRAWNREVDKSLVINQNGKLLSGRDLTLEAYNGNIEVTGNTAAKRNMTVDIANAGNITFGVGVAVDGDLAMKTKTGSIHVGKDLTAGGKADLRTGTGDVLVGLVDSGDDGDVKAGQDVTIETGKGAVAVRRTVASDNGSVTIHDVDGDIWIGANGPDVDTVSAKQNINLIADNGTVTVLGKTESRSGDIKLHAHSQQADWNFVIAQDGKLVSGRDLTLEAYNGNIVVTDKTTAKRNMTVDIANAGAIGFGVDIAVDGDLAMRTKEGSILVGKDLTAGGKTELRTGAGDVLVGLEDSGNDGDVKAGQDVTIETGKGAVAVRRTVASNDGSVTIHDVEGDILIGANGPDVDTVSAKQDVNLIADNGTVSVFGKTESRSGDIKLHAHSQRTDWNFVIAQDGKLVSGRDLTLEAYNGDIAVSGNTTAKRNMTVDIANKGNIGFGVGVAVDGDLALKTGTGSILVGKDLTAGGKAELRTGTGDVLVGLEDSGNDGDVKAAKDVTIETGKGIVGVRRTVISDNGSVAIADKEGGIWIGNNGENVDTVSAKQNIDLIAENGTVSVYGKTESQSGDIKVRAWSKEADNSLVIEQNGKLLSGRDLTLEAYNGDITVTGKTAAKRNMTVDIANKGNIGFGVDVTVDGDLAMKTNTGNILVGQDLTAGGKADLQTKAGNVVVGYKGDGDVKAKQDVTIKTGEGLVDIAKTVISENGSVKVDNGKGNIQIGDNGADVDTVSAKQNIDLLAENGTVTVRGKTESQDGDIKVRAWSKEADKSLVIEHNGKLLSGRDLTLEAYNGDITVTGNTAAKRNMTVDIANQGNIGFGVDVTVDGDLAMKTKTGSILVGKDLTAGGKADLQTGTGDVVVGYNGDGDVKANQDVTIKTGNGSVGIRRTVISENGNVEIDNRKGNILIGNNGPDVKTVSAKQNVKLLADDGQIDIQGKTATETGDITVKAGTQTYREGNTDNIAFGVNGQLESGKDAYLIAKNGDLRVTHNVTANGTFYAQTEERGNIDLGEDLTVKNDLSMRTDTGKITVGKNVTAAQGSVAMRTGTGDVTIGADVKAGENVTATTTSGDVKVGANVEAGKNVTATTTSGNVTVGADVKAGEAVTMKTATGNVTVGSGGKGSVTATNDVTVEVGTGAVSIEKAVASEQGSVAVQTKDGNIHIGNERGAYMVTAKKDLTLATDKGQITIDGGASTQEGDIRVKAGWSEYNPNGNGKNIAFGADGKLTSGKDAYLIAQNGDLQVTDNVTANGTFYAQTEGKGNITLGKDLTVTNNLSMKTQTGDITVGKNVTAAQGSVAMQAGTGAVTIGADVKAGENVTATTTSGDVKVDANVEAGKSVIAKTTSGNVTIGADVKAGENVTATTTSGNVTVGADVKAGDAVTMKTTTGNVTVGSGGKGSVTATNDVTVEVGTGAVSIEKAVASKQGSVSVQTKGGDIYIGNTPGADTVTARKNLTLATDKGQIKVYGSASTKEGDILVKAVRPTYEAKDDNIAFGADGKLEAGKDAYLIAKNGDLEVTGNVTANGTFYAQTEGKGNITLGKELAVKNSLAMETQTGNITVGKNVTAAQGSVSMRTGTGNVTVGVGDEGSVTAKGDVTVEVGKGAVSVEKAVVSKQGNVSMQTNDGDIQIGNNPGAYMVEAQQNLTLATDNGQIAINGGAATKEGDILVKAGWPTYAPNANRENIAFGADGQLTSGKDAYLIAQNGDLVVTDDVTAKGTFYAQTAGTGNITLGKDLSVTNSLAMITETGNITVGHDLTSQQGSVTMQAGTGDVLVGVNGQGSVTAKQDINVAIDSGDLGIATSLQSREGSVNAKVGSGDILVGDNGPDVETVTAKQNVDLETGKGTITVYGKTSTENGDIALKAASNDFTWDAQNIVIDQNGMLDSGRDVRMAGRNGDLYVTDRIRAKRNLDVRTSEQGSVFFDNPVTVAGDVHVAAQNGLIVVDEVTAAGNTTVSVTGEGYILGNQLISGETTRVELTNGDVLLYSAEGKTVLLHMENNTEASYVDQVLANASGVTDPDVGMTGNYIQIGSIASKGGDAVFRVSATGAGGQKLIAEEFYVGSLRSKSGTEMPSLWTNRGYLHVDEGNLAMDDALAVDKLYVDNAQTNLAIFGRTPTRDGEQLVYWNNLGMANSKARSFQLYTDGKVRTHGAVLVDAERYYDKLYGDNLSVVDMMRERVTHTHGAFTFDSAQLTEPGRLMRQPVFFGMESAEAILQQQSASDAEIVVE